MTHPPGAHDHTRRGTCRDGVVGLIPAAGMARRLGIATPKELIEVDGRPVIDYSVDHMVEAGVRTIVVVIRRGKEEIRRHLDESYPGMDFDYVYQRGEIGNLLDAIRAAAPRLVGDTVHFLMPDTVITPNPFREQPSGDITLLCFRAEGEAWRNFGVVAPDEGRIIDKPDRFVGDICWGALSWEPSFTERVVGHDTLTDAINDSNWSHRMTIDDYCDIGLGSTHHIQQAAR